MSRSASASSRVRLLWDVRIPLRDGVHLSATVYLSKVETARAPCIVALTPYIADHLHERACFFAANGFPFVVVDVRGRGNSEGEFRPYLQEASDGHDVVCWVATQLYCNGKVALYGGSYLGYCQWATAKELPPALATMVPTASPYMGVDVPMRNNIVYPFIVQWLTFTSGHTSQARTHADRSFWAAAFRAWHESGRPLREIDTLLGNPSAILQEWLQHPEPDEYWDTHNPTPGQYARLDLPILTITGSYDDDQPGALEHYRQHLLNASPRARQRHYLVIGPWDHASTGTPGSEFGGLRLGPDSMVNIPRLHLDWYTWTLCNGPKPDFLKKRVAYYVTGSECWRYADTLEGITAGHLSYFLSSCNDPTDVFLSGTLESALEEGPPGRYTYNPLDYDGPELDAETAADGGSLTDQSLTLALREKQFVYHSAPFEQDTELAGFFKLQIWLAIDCPDTDFYVSVHEIALDGSSLRLSTDAMRARYREGPRTSRLIDTREPLLYDFERFTFVARQVKRGHRLRLVLAPMGRIIEATFAQKNYCGGGRVAEESAAEARSVTVTIFHDAAHPGVLHVPLGRAPTAD